MSYQFQDPFSFHFVHHGVTELNFRGLRCGGDLDVPLADIGCGHWNDRGNEGRGCGALVPGFRMAERSKNVRLTLPHSTYQR